MTDREYEDEDFAMLNKLLRQQIEEETNRMHALSNLTFDDFITILYDSWRVHCEPETHLDLEYMWRRMTGETT